MNAVGWIKLKVPVVTLGEHSNEPLDSKQSVSSVCDRATPIFWINTVFHKDISSLWLAACFVQPEVTTTCHCNVVLDTFVSFAGSSSSRRLILGLLDPEGTLILWHIWNCWPRRASSHLWRPESFSAVAVQKPQILQHPFTFLSVKVWREGRIRKKRQNAYNYIVMYRNAHTYLSKMSSIISYGTIFVI
jgi:hypothetical protein